MIKRGTVVRIKAQNGTPVGSYYKVVSAQKKIVVLKRIQNGMVVENEKYTCSYDKIHEYMSDNTCVTMSVYERLKQLKTLAKIEVSPTKKFDQILSKNAHILNVHTSKKGPAIYVQYGYAIRVLTRKRTGLITKTTPIIRLCNVTVL